MRTGCVDSILNTMRNSSDVIEIDNTVILNTIQIFHFLEFSIFVYQVGLKPNIGKIFKTNIILLQNIFILIGIVNKNSFTKNKFDFQ